MANYREDEEESLDVGMDLEDLASEGTATHSDRITLAELKLGEIWRANDHDISAFRYLAKHFQGEEAGRAYTFPGAVRNSQAYKTIVAKSTYTGGKAQTLLAIIMNLYNPKLKELSHSGIIGTMAEEDLSLKTLREVVLPTLIEDLLPYAGWAGFKIPNRVSLHTDSEEQITKKYQENSSYIRDFLLENLATDPMTSDQVERYFEFIKGSAIDLSSKVQLGDTRKAMSGGSNYRNVSVEFGKRTEARVSVMM